MSRRSAVVGGLAIVLAAAPAFAGPARITTMRLAAETTIAAAPDAVWKSLTEGQSLVTWCPVWKSEGNKKVKLTKVGDVLDFTDEYGNGGRSVVTYLEAGKELRVAHEPNDGSYVCQAKITLVPDGGATKVMYTEQYTDEQDAAAADATAAKTEAGMQQTLAALRRSVQGPE